MIKRPMQLYLGRPNSTRNLHRLSEIVELIQIELQWALLRVSPRRAGRGIMTCRQARCGSFLAGSMKEAYFSGFFILTEKEGFQFGDSNDSARCYTRPL